MAKKNKVNSGKPGVFSPKQIRENSEKILEHTCNQLAGPGHYQKFSSYSRELILANRYGPVKLHGTGDKILDTIFRENLNATFVTSETGAQIPLSCYLREGIMLIQYVEMMARENRDIHADLVAAFEPYFHQTKIYRGNLNKLISILRRIALLQSSWKETIFSYDLGSLCAISGIAAANDIPVTVHKPQTLALELDGHKREILRIGWPEVLGGINWISISPSKVGFFNTGKETCPVYIQRHALNRLQERLGLLAGIIHEAVTESLLADTCNWQRFNEKTLVPLLILSKKVGYLVISYNKEKIIIRSFLFLTNNGTPEGNRLSKLTRLAPQDKKYLEMDTLPGFAGFDFQLHPELAALFRQTGCEDLLRLEDLILFNENMTMKKDPEQLMKYLTQHQTRVRSG